MEEPFLLALTITPSIGPSALELTKPLMTGASLEERLRFFKVSVVAALQKVVNRGTVTTTKKKRKLTLKLRRVKLALVGILFFMSLCDASYL